MPWDNNFMAHIMVCFEFQIIKLNYRNDPKFLDRQVWVNSADPDQTDQGLHCLQFPLHLLNALLFSKAILFKF